MYSSVGRWRIWRIRLGLLIILRISLLLLHVCTLILEVRVGEEEGAGLLTAN